MKHENITLVKSQCILMYSYQSNFFFSKILFSHSRYIYIYIYIYLIWKSHINLKIKLICDIYLIFTLQINFVKMY